MSRSQNQSSGLKVLVIDDDVFITQILKSIGEKLGCVTDCIHDGKDVGSALIASKPDIIFLDLVLPNIDGVEIIQTLAQLNVDAKIVLMSGLDQRTLSSVSGVAKKHNLDVIHTIKKPFAPGQVEEILSPLISSRLSFSPALEDTPKALSFGPKLRYEPDFSFQESVSEEANWIRVHLMWLMNNGQTMDMKMLASSSFLPDMSRGLIEYTIERAAEDHVLLSEGGTNIGLRIAVSDDLLNDPSLPEFLEQVTTQNNLVPSKLMLEISEASVSETPEATLNILARLKIKGFNLAICVRDEAENILESLKILPVDELLIDMSGAKFLKDNLNKIETEFQLGSLVSYAKGVELSTSSKNVVNEAQFNFSQHCQLNKASGKHISPAVDADDLIEFYRNAVRTGAYKTASA